jgi:hypothetical protein
MIDIGMLLGLLESPSHDVARQSLTVILTLHRREASYHLTASIGVQRIPSGCIFHKKSGLSILMSY